MEEADATKFRDDHARKHHGQDYECEPVLPYNDSGSDILHLYLNIKKVRGSRTRSRRTRRSSTQRRWHCVTSIAAGTPPSPLALRDFHHREPGPW